MWVTSRQEAKRAQALKLGAEAVFETGARLPEKVDAVMETVGAATWSHSVNVLRPGGTIVLSGATSGDSPKRTELTKVFFRQLRIVGSTMGNRQELDRLARLVVARNIDVAIDSVMPLGQARTGFERLSAGEVFGKIAFTV